MYVRGSNQGVEFKRDDQSFYKGIVVKNKQHVFLDKSKCIKFANKNKMFISVK